MVGILISQSPMNYLTKEITLPKVILGLFVGGVLLGLSKMPELIPEDLPRWFYFYIYFSFFCVAFFFICVIAKMWSVETTPTKKKVSVSESESGFELTLEGASGDSPYKITVPSKAPTSKDATLRVEFLPGNSQEIHLKWGGAD